MASDQSLLRGGLVVTLLGGILSIAAVLLQYWLRPDAPQAADQTSISVRAGDAIPSATRDTKPPRGTGAAEEGGEGLSEDAPSSTTVRSLPREEETDPAKLSDRRLQENCLNHGRVEAARGDKLLVILAVRPAGAGPEADSSPPSDLIRGRLADRITEHQRAAATDAFKPWFYSSGLFDSVWAGESELLVRLGLLAEARDSVLLAKAEFAPARQTDFAGVCYVEGTLSLCLVTTRGTQGPVTLSMSGSGGSATQAALACARRLVDSVDLKPLFAEERDPVQ